MAEILFQHILEQRSQTGNRDDGLFTEEIHGNNLAQGSTVVKPAGHSKVDPGRGFAYDARHEQLPLYPDHLL